MARAKRHYIPGQIWHLTHRCHKREFLLKLVKDRRRWLQWLFQAKKRYDLKILNYTVTSNHIHLLVVDGKERGCIPQSMQLIAGRTAQEYNLRKKRKGAFWEDRYHATAVESKVHLMRCLIYIDLNMVRTGKVVHPSEWPFCGYNELQKPRRKTTLIDYQKVTSLTGFVTYDAFRKAHRSQVETSLANDDKKRQPGWTESIAVGSREFAKEVKEQLGYRLKGRKIIQGSDAYELREKNGSYSSHFDGEMKDIGSENTYPWSISHSTSVT